MLLLVSRSSPLLLSPYRSARADAADQGCVLRCALLFRVRWERRLPAGTGMRVSASLAAHMMVATVCRLEAGAPRRDDAARAKK